MRRKKVAALAAVASLALVAAAMAQTSSTRINLPNGWQPEGVAAGGNNTLFVGSIPTGAVLRVSSRTGRTRVVVSGRSGRQAIGLKAVAGRLFVAGGGTGRGWVYSARTGRQIKAFRLAPAGADTFINDVVVTRDAAYFTDSQRMALYVVPRDLSRARQLRVSGIRRRAGNNLNGIVATPDGKALIAVQTNTGRLWRIDPQSGRAAAIDLGGASMANGDGLLLAGRRLYVVRNQDNRIAVVNLARDLLSGTVARTISSRDFDVPTTVARIGGRLYAVNARFGTTATARTRYWLTRVTG